jgi:hypothetical protein
MRWPLCGHAGVRASLNHSTRFFLWLAAKPAQRLGARGPALIGRPNCSADRSIAATIGDFPRQQNGPNGKGYRQHRLVASRAPMT